MNNKPERKALRNAIAVLCAFIMCLSALTSPAFALKAHAEPNDYQPPLALKTLWEQNHHVIGGLFIPGTTVCYPILQHPSIDLHQQGGGAELQHLQHGHLRPQHA